MPTDLCAWCGLTFEAGWGHTCMPTTQTTGTGPPSVAGPPPDFQQAIQGKIGVDKDQNQLLVDVPGTAHVIADALGQLHAAQGEMAQLKHLLDWAYPLLDDNHTDDETWRLLNEQRAVLQAEIQAALGQVEREETQ